MSIERGVLRYLLRLGEAATSERVADALRYKRVIVAPVMMRMVQDKLLRVSGGKSPCYSVTEVGARRLEAASAGKPNAESAADLLAAILQKWPATAGE